MGKSKKQYYLGLDIGTDSVGYAATNEAYQLMKFRGEPVWGVTTFEAASLARGTAAVSYGQAAAGPQKAAGADDKRDFCAGNLPNRSSLFYPEKRERAF